MRYLGDDGRTYATAEEARVGDLKAKEAKERRERARTSFAIFSPEGKDWGETGLTQSDGYDRVFCFLRVDNYAEDVFSHLRCRYGDEFYGFKECGLYVVTGRGYWDREGYDYAYHVQTYENWKTEQLERIDVGNQLLKRAKGEGEIGE